MIEELVVKNRSYRRFRQEYSISRVDLLQLVDLARQCPSGANLQPLRYMLSWTEGRNSVIFPTLAWAGYLTDWHGPEDGERPSAYIICMAEVAASRERVLFTDLGIASQSILLGAVERGLGGCIVHSVNRPALQETLGIPAAYQILQVIALGKPAEQVTLEETNADGDIKYWRDRDGIHHVPKRRLSDIVVEV